LTEGLILVILAILALEAHAGIAGAAISSSHRMDPCHDMMLTDAQNALLCRLTGVYSAIIGGHREVAAVVASRPAVQPKSRHAK